MLFMSSCRYSDSLVFFNHLQLIIQCSTLYVERGSHGKKKLNERRTKTKAKRDEENERERKRTKIRRKSKV